MSFLKQTIKRASIPWLLLLLAILLCSIWAQFPESLNHYYSNGLYVYISLFLRKISGIFPFAIGDVFYLIYFALMVYLIVRPLFQAKTKTLAQKAGSFLKQVLFYSLFSFLLFKLLWGLNYSRPRIATALGLKQEKYDAKELFKLSTYFIKQTVELKAQTEGRAAQSFAEIKASAVQAYALAAEKESFLHYSRPVLKATLWPKTVSNLGLAGFYNPLSGEAQVNTLLPHFNQAFVACHEIAHQLGIAYEDEANLTAFYVARHSPDLQLRYSAYYEMLRYLLYELKRKDPEAYLQAHTQLSAGVLKDLSSEQDFWSRHNSSMFIYMDATFDTFLKLNQQEKGTASYQDIVIWLYNMYKQEI